MDTKLNRFKQETINVPIEVNLLKEIQRLSINTNEIYDSQTIEDLVHNILNTERLRLKKINEKQAAPQKPE